MRTKNLLKRIGMALLASTILAASVVPALAARDDKTPENPVPAVIQVAKKLKSSTGLFPTISTSAEYAANPSTANVFKFTLTPFKFTDRAGASTSAGAGGVVTFTDGSPALKMPMPEEATAGVNTGVEAPPTTNTAATNNGGKTLVITKDYYDANTSTTPVNEKNYARYFPALDFEAKDMIPGVYTYLLEEEDTGVPGVTYDGAKYYVQIYVGNQMYDDKTPVLCTDPDHTHDTVVTVTGMTVWKNKADAPSDPNAENGPKQNNSLTNHAQEAKVDFTTSTTLVPGTTTEPGDPADQGAHGDFTASTVQYPFLNTYAASNLTISKTVSGTLADPTKYFTFTVALQSGESDGSTVTKTDYKPTLTYTIHTVGEDATIDATTYANDGYVRRTVDASGNITDTVLDQAAYDAAIAADPTDNLVYTLDLNKGDTIKLKHDQYVVIHNIPTVNDGTYATVTESDADGYKTNVAVTAGGTLRDQPDASKGKFEAPNLRATADQELLVPEDDNDKTYNYWAFENNKQHTPPTGVLLTMLPFAVILIGAGAGLVLISRKRKAHR